MNTSKLLPLCLGLSLSLTGCGILKKKQPEPAASVATPSTALTPPPPAPPAPAPIVAAQPALDEAAVPAPQDFEDEAFEKVTPANFKAELARLTKEINTPPAAAK